ncbi:hypothetical protein NEFER03_1195 [Nematocida sp. LUAm3]|nr:hypothetical protein NEFER03_1195 [Nematocida sp. LUAm3]KAI5175804.1 hypothetical protein NEFER02_1673 [Nematocida sp. LUAm2]KAI5178300.1 hypothetical protein NEFER01_1467 [Nematocida sp. LUAm1]
MFIPILYGTNGGKSLGLCKMLLKEIEKIEAGEEKVSGKILEMDQVDVKTLGEMQIMLFVCSTTGDGEAPYNMQRFWKELKRRSLDGKFSNLHFSVAGLGDSSYSKYNYAGKRLFTRLKQVGGMPLVPRSDCDDMDERGVYTAFDKWVLEVVQAIKEHLSRKQENTHVLCSQKIFLANETPLITAILSEKRKIAPYEEVSDLSSCGSGYSEILDLVFVIPKEVCSLEYTYEPGDVLEIHPRNLQHKDFVSEFIMQVEEDSLDFLYVDYTCVPMHHTIRQIYSYAVDGKYIQFKETVYNSDNYLSRLQEIAESYDEYYSYVLQPLRTLQEVLRDFFLTVHPKAEIFERISSRYYTISRNEEDKYSITAGLVKKKTSLKIPRKGVCSEYFRELPLGSEVSVRIRKSHLSLHGDLLLLSSGTGISLARSIIHSYVQGKSSSITSISLVFGFRSLLYDCLYLEELLACISSNSSMPFISSFAQPHAIFPESHLSSLSTCNIHASKNGFYIKMSSTISKDKEITVFLCPSRIKEDLLNTKAKYRNILEIENIDESLLPEKNYLTRIPFLLAEEDIKKEIVISGGYKVCKAVVAALEKHSNAPLNIQKECW